MPTAVVDLDLEKLPRSFETLRQYRRALLLLRLHGRPVGQLQLPLIDGRISAIELRESVLHACEWALRADMLRMYVGELEEPRPTVPTSVAICTRDRVADLRRCLDALAKLPDDGQEILVIDNCPSTDATMHLVLSRRDARIRYVREERPGLNVARNRALREARHEIVVFTDDDAAPDSGWLRALVANFEDPMVLCTTGLIMPLELETEAQEWFERFSSFGRGFRRNVFDGATYNPRRVGQIGAGASMAVRSNLLHAIGGFDEALDAGTPTRSGGDQEIFSRILAAGYKIVYDPAALSWHRHRRTWEELQYVLYGYRVGVYARWTRSLLVEYDLGVLAEAASWLRHTQLRSLVRSALRWPGSAPLDLQLAELRGCIAGPAAYLSGRQLARDRDHPA